MKYVVEIAGRSVGVEFRADEVLVEGKALTVMMEGAGPVRRILLGETSIELVAVPLEGRGQWRLLARGFRLDAVALDERTRAVRAISVGPAKGAGGGQVRAPMPGLVVRVMVAEGQRVEAGHGLVVVEAMKMENELRAARAGVVRRILTAAGKPVEKGDTLIELE